MIEETKLEEETMLEVGTKIWKSRKSKAIGAMGALGGICTLWEGNSFDLWYVLLLHHWFMVTLLHKILGKQINIFNVYYPNMYIEKQQFWKTLIENKKT